MQTFGDPPSSSAHVEPVPSRTDQHVELALLLAATLGISLWSVRSSGGPTVIAALLGVLPSVIALQHGLLGGLLGIGLVVSSLAFAPGAAASALLSPMLAPFTLALAVGHFSARAQRDKHALAQRSAEQARQLEQLSRTYDALRSAHLKLEQRLARESSHAGTVAPGAPRGREGADALTRTLRMSEAVTGTLPPPTRALERLRGVAIRIGPGLVPSAAPVEPEAGPVEESTPPTTIDAAHGDEDGDAAPRRPVEMEEVRS